MLSNPFRVPSFGLAGLSGEGMLAVFLQLRKKMHPTTTTSNVRNIGFMVRRLRVKSDYYYREFVRRDSTKSIGFLLCL
jgi:hypothetical protein